MERTFVGVNQAKAAMAADGTVRKLGSLCTWVNTNISKASNGSNGSGAGASARSDGSARTFTETLLKAANLKIGEPILGINLRELHSKINKIAVRKGRCERR